tara:strand:- start:2874 stop:3104 length:231 start_codon:yes stop_codon:yes gene_type:complete
VIKFLFFNILLTFLNLFILIYSYSLKFFPIKWRKKVNQDTIVGLAIIFSTMINFFAWAIYLYLLFFENLDISGETI